MENAIRKGCDVVVGTCGRVWVITSFPIVLSRALFLTLFLSSLQDLLEKRTLKFDNIQYVIMDEV
jgi:superfamily II DNA/RNA helicase